MKKILSLVLFVLFLAPASLAGAGDMEPASISDLSRILPVDDAGIDGHANEKDANKGGQVEAAISGTFQPFGYERFYYLKFDLSELVTDKKIKKASVNLTGRGITGGGVFGLFKSENDNWKQDEITYNNADRTWVSAANKEKNLLDEIDNFTSASTRAFDVTGFVRDEMKGDKIITVILREISTRGGNFNPYHAFHTSRAAVASNQPYLNIEFYEEGDDELGLIDYTFKKGGQDITKTGLVAGDIECNVNIEHNIPDGMSAPATVLFALCYGTEESYRVSQCKISVGIVPAGESRSFSETVSVPQDTQRNYFIKVFMWNSLDKKQVYLPSFSFE